MSQRPIVYVVDDDASVRKAAARLFRSVDMGVETFGSADSFLQHERADAPGCLVLDVQMPGQTGMELQQALAAGGVDLPIVFMTGHGDIPMSVRAMKFGAADFLPKPVDDEELLEAVTRAIEGHERARAESSDLQAFRQRIDTLTDRERQVLALVVAGKLNKQIAADLGISLDTVKVHRGRVMRKAGVESLAELVRLYERAGLQAP